MAKEKLRLTAEFPVAPETVYHAWLNSKAHSEFTGSKAIITPKVKSKYSAWDGYITGEITELEEGKRILHSWRSDEFPEDSEDSIVEVTFENTAAGCRMAINHWNIPEGQKEQYREGWEEYYFKPMREFFNRR
jgi:activator of HSP90 ATPase